eukprot:2584881-Pyramimonas_sp.AAC.1
MLAEYDNYNDDWQYDSRDDLSVVACAAILETTTALPRGLFFRSKGGSFTLTRLQPRLRPGSIHLELASEPKRVSGRISGMEERTE